MTRVFQALGNDNDNTEWFNISVSTGVAMLFMGIIIPRLQPSLPTAVEVMHEMALLKALSVIGLRWNWYKFDGRMCERLSNVFDFVVRS